MALGSIIYFALRRQIQSRLNEYQKRVANERAEKLKPTENPNVHSTTASEDITNVTGKGPEPAGKFRKDFIAKLMCAVSPSCGCTVREVIRSPP